MRPSISPAPTFEHHLDDAWARRALRDDVRQGLAQHPLRLPPRWMYDERGSELFDRITRLDEYYLTEAERTILEDVAPTVARITDADTLIELGSGTSDKTRTLIDAFRSHGTLQRFVTFDVSEETLREAASALHTRFPGLRIHGIVGDFTLHLGHLPTDGTPLVAFLGSTIGNFYAEERRAFLSMLGDQLPAGGWLLLGVDLIKPVERLIRAYDDRERVTEAFSRNVLHVLNRELGADFDPESFDHIAFWDPRNERMDLRLRADGDQHVRVRDADLDIAVHDGDEIRVEVSTKFRLDRVDAELREVGLDSRHVWSDPAGDVAVILAART